MTKECYRTAKRYNNKILKAKQTCNNLQQSVSHQTVLKLRQTEDSGREHFEHENWSQLTEVFTFSLVLFSFL